MMRDVKSHPAWLNLTLVIIIPFLSMALGVGFTMLAGMGHAPYANLVVNLFFSFACLIILLKVKFTPIELGLRLDKSRLKGHILLSLAVFCLYMLFYILVIRISGFKTWTASTFWGLLNYLVVVVVEEIYFRGMVYSLTEKRFSSLAALTASSLLFGLFHARQGLSGILRRSLTGWLWGSVRYATGMIYLLIFPVHFTYNAVWLLFNGNWDNPPTWAVIGLPIVEFVLGLVIVLARKAKQQRVS